MAKVTSFDYPPTPTDFGKLVSQFHLLGEQLEKLMMAACRSLPSDAPFDWLDPRDTHLWRVCMDAEHLLKHCGWGPEPLPWVEPGEEEEIREES